MAECEFSVGGFRNLAESRDLVCGVNAGYGGMGRVEFKR
jgi:hypothetical protein